MSEMSKNKENNGKKNNFFTIIKSLRWLFVVGTFTLLVIPIANVISVIKTSFTNKRDVILPFLKKLDLDLLKNKDKLPEYIHTNDISLTAHSLFNIIFGITQFKDNVKNNFFIHNVVVKKIKLNDNFFKIIKDNIYHEAENAININNLNLNKINIKKLSNKNYDKHELIKNIFNNIGLKDKQIFHVTKIENQQSYNFLVLYSLIDNRIYSIKSLEEEIDDNLINFVKDKIITLICDDDDFFEQKGIKTNIIICKDINNNDIDKIIINRFSDFDTKEINLDPRINDMINDKFSSYIENLFSNKENNYEEIGKYIFDSNNDIKEPHIFYNRSLELKTDNSDLSEKDELLDIKAYLSYLYEDFTNIKKEKLYLINGDVYSISIQKDILQKEKDLYFLNLINNNAIEIFIGKNDKVLENENPFFPLSHFLNMDIINEDIYFNNIDYISYKNKIPFENLSNIFNNYSITKEFNDTKNIIFYSKKENVIILISITLKGLKYEDYLFTEASKTNFKLFRYFQREYK